MRFYKSFLLYLKHFGLKTAWQASLKPRLLPKFTSKQTYGSLFYEGVNAFFEREFRDVCNRYKSVKLKSFNQEPLPSDYKIWVFWYQGFDNLPPIIDLCQQSLKKNANGHEIVRIDKNNIKQYVSLPDYIWSHLESETISLSHFSDILRFTLLKEHGGLWIDAAMFVVKPLELTGLSYFSPKINIPAQDVISQFKWTFGIIALPQNTFFMNFVCDVLMSYWQKFDYAIFYLYIDLIIRESYDLFPSIKSLIDNCNVYSTDLHRCRYLFNDRCNDDEFKNIIDHNQFISLTYRFNYDMKTVAGEQTYFGRLLEYFDFQYVND